MELKMEYLLKFLSPESEGFQCL